MYFTSVLFFRHSYHGYFVLLARHSFVVIHVLGHHQLVAYVLHMRSESSRTMIDVRYSPFTASARCIER